MEGIIFFPERSSVFFLAPFVGKTVFHPCSVLVPWSKSIGHICLSMFLDSLFFSTDVYGYPFTNAILSQLL